MSLSTLAFTQSAAPKSFYKLKTLAGWWAGTMDGKSRRGQVTMRVTSMGNTLMHEMKSGERPDGNRLLMTHYCAAGNQPRMVGTVSPDGKTITFDFLNATNLQRSQEGHMQHVVFTLIDSDHHTELWEFAMADGKKMGGLLDLHRTK